MMSLRGLKGRVNVGARNGCRRHRNKVSVGVKARVRARAKACNQELMA